MRVDAGLLARLQRLVVVLLINIDVVVNFGLIAT